MSSVYMIEGEIHAEQSSEYSSFDDALDSFLAAETSEGSTAKPVPVVEQFDNDWNNAAKESVDRASEATSVIGQELLESIEKYDRPAAADSQSENLP